MRRIWAIQLPLLGILVSPVSAFASTVTGNATEVSAHVPDSMAGPTAAADPRVQQQAGAPGPAVASGMPLSDFAGLPMMLVSPPHSYQLAPHQKLRSLSGSAAADAGSGGGNMSFQAGNGDGGTASLGSVGSAPQTIPEPLTVLLAGPALALAIRRRFKG